MEEMLEEMLEDIIDIFASNKISEIAPRSKEEIKKKYCLKKIISVDTIFYEYNNLVQECKKQIESIEYDYQDPKIQARECLVYLRLIRDEENVITDEENVKRDKENVFTDEENVIRDKKNDKKNDKKINIFVKLVYKCFCNKIWSELPDVITYFNDRLPFVKDWKDFFFSYTNRNAKETNIDFRKCLPDIEYHVDNKLAEYIATQLLSQNLSGFWDYNDIKLGVGIKGEIFDNCKKSYCFVQLIEQIVFSVPMGGKKNWCYEEYKAFNRRSLDSPEIQSLSDNYFFIIQDDRALKIANLPPSYYYWHSEIVSKKYLELTYYNDQNRRKIRYDIDKLAVRIMEIRKETLDCLLN